MMRLRPHRSTPPGGIYFYQVPETRTVLEHPVLDVLMINLRAHYTNNKIDIPADLRARVEDWMCRQMPPGVCEGTPEPGVRVRRVLTKDMVRDFSRLLFERALSLVGRGRFYVEQAEAERRAAICVACPRQDPSFCVTCDQLETFAAKFLASPEKQVTTFDSRLSVCTECGCLLRTKVWVHKDAMRRLTQREYPKWCWMSPGGGRKPTEEEQLHG